MKPKVVVAGCGGHAKAIAEIIEFRGEFEIAGFTTATTAPTRLSPILGCDDDLPTIFQTGIERGFVAIGDNRIRKRVIDRMRAIGFTLINVISPSAHVSTRAQLGAGIVIMPGVVVQTDAVIADGVIVNTGATVDHDCEIGECAHIAPGCHLGGNVCVEQGALMGIGSQAIPGVRVGAWSTVGSGAAVTRNLPPGVTAVGVPATVIKRAPAT